MKLFARKFLAAMLSAALILPGATPVVNAVAATSDEKQIQILNTSDLHGKFVPYSYAIDEESTSGSLAQVATLIKERKNDNTLLIDCGDTIQDNSADLFLNDDIHPMIKGLNMLNYDVWIAGNHEFNYGVPTLQKIAKTFQGAFLCGNVYDTDGKTTLGKTYEIFEVDGVKIAVIGMVTPNITRWDSANLEGYKVTNPIDETKKAIEEVKDKADVIIGAFHMDNSEEYEVKGSGAEDLADACPELDVILASHGHHQLNETHNGVLITENVNQGATMADIDLTLKSDGKGGWDVTAKTAEILSANGVAADEEITTALESYDARAKADAQTKVGTLKGGDLVPVQEIPSITQSQIQETAMMNLINQVQMYYGKAEVSAAAAFSANANMKKGTIRKKDNALIYKFDNTLYRLEMTGKQLKTYMEWSANYYNTYKEGDLTVSFNPDVRSYLYDMFAGVTYDINISKEPGQRIENLKRASDGTEIKDTDKITIAVNNYRANSQLLQYGSVFFEENGDELPKLLEKDINAGEGVREMIGRWIVEENKGTIIPKYTGSWRITGNNWDEAKHDRVVALAAAGKISIPTSEDGRTPNVKSVTEEDLKAFEGVTTSRVKFDGNGGIASGDNVCYVDGTKYGQAATAFREGYVFNGWYTAATGGSKLSKAEIEALKTDTTLYAQWSKAKPAKATVKSLKAGKKSLTVKLNAVKGAKGYKVYYSTDKNFKKNVKTVTAKKTTVKLTNLTSKKTYYVKAKAYRADSVGTNVFGAAGTAKKAKVK